MLDAGYDPAAAQDFGAPEQEAKSALTLGYKVWSIRSLAASAVLFRKHPLSQPCRLQI